MKFSVRTSAFLLLLCSGMFQTFATEAAVASEVEVRGRSYFANCSDLTTMQGEFEITYRNTDLPWGTQVKVASGWSGYRDVYNGPSPGRISLDWDSRVEQAMKGGAPYTWTTQISRALAERSQPFLIEGLQFVIFVTLPDGTTFIEKGSDTTWGYFQADFKGTNEACIRGNPPPFRELRVKAIRKD